MLIDSSPRTMLNSAPAFAEEAEKKPSGVSAAQASFPPLNSDARSLPEFVSQILTIRSLPTEASRRSSALVDISRLPGFASSGKRGHLLAGRRVRTPMPNRGHRPSRSCRRRATVSPE